jgi:superfamily II DNA/RNA helicase
MQAIVFCNAPSRVEWLHAQMLERNLAASALHPSQDVIERENAHRNFQGGMARVLIATCDGTLPNASMIINFELDNVYQYFERSV